MCVVGVSNWFITRVQVDGGWMGVVQVLERVFVTVDSLLAHYRLTIDLLSNTIYISHVQ